MFTIYELPVHQSQLCTFSRVKLAHTAVVI